MTVQPGSPAAHAGILPGDRLFATGSSRSTVLTAGPLERARPAGRSWSSVRATA